MRLTNIVTLHRTALWAAAACAVALACGSEPATAMVHHPVSSAHSETSTPHLLAAGLGATVGSTVGPGGALYVTDAISGTLERVDPRTGNHRVVADGLPTRVVPGLGGAMDVTFVHKTAYVLVTLVGSDVGGTSADGIYRIDRPHHHPRLVADIGAYASAHPPTTDFFVPSGVQFALQRHRGGFLVTDGHHNRVYGVSIDGAVSVVQNFANVAPTGLDVWRNRVFMAEAGPVPHSPSDGRVVRLDLASGTSRPVARGARLAVDVAHTGHDLYALSQGIFPAGNDPGTPAGHDSGFLLKVNGNGSMTRVVGRIDQPTSVQIIGHTAYIVTLNGEVLTAVLPHRACHRR